MGNPISRFFGFISNPSYSRTTGLLVILVIALSIPLTVFVAQKQQEIRQQAAVSIDPGGGGGTGPSTTKPACTGVCTGVQTCHLVEGGRIDTSMTCSSPNTACCVVGSSLKVTCEGDCIGEDFYKGQEVAKGTCQTNQVCVKKSGTSTAPTTSSEVPCGNQGGICRAGVCVVGPNRDVIDADGSAVCKSGAGGTPTCPGSGKPSSGWGGSCSPEGNTDKLSISSGVCSVVGCQRYTNGALCWYNGGQVYNDPSSCPTTGGTTPTAPPPSPPPIGGTTCGAPYSGSCTQLNARQEPTCTKSSGASGKSVKVCQQVGSSLCWYDQYTDTNKTQAERDAGCYATTGTQIAFTIGLNGLGTTGDFRSSNSSGSNKDPKHPSRKLFYQIFDTGINQVAEGQSNDLRYDPASGKFKATVDLGKVLPNGNYIAKVRAEGYLVKVIRRTTSFPTPEAAITVTAGQVAEAPLVNLVTGDSDGDNKLSVLDYNNLLSCLFKGPYAPNTICRLMDLDDNLEVNQFDYNLLLREFPAGQGE